MSEKALTSQQMPKLQAALAAIVCSTPEGVTVLMRDGYLEKGSNALNFEELPTPVLAPLREINPTTFERTTRQSCRAWFFSAREQDSLVACGLLAATPEETDLKEMMASPTS